MIPRRLPRWGFHFYIPVSQKGINCSILSETSVVTVLFIIWTKPTYLGNKKNTIMGNIFVAKDDNLIISGIPGKLSQKGSTLQSYWIDNNLFNLFTFIHLFITDDVKNYAKFVWDTVLPYLYYNFNKAAWNLLAIISTYRDHRKHCSTLWWSTAQNTWFMHDTIFSCL